MCGNMSEVEAQDIFQFEKFARYVLLHVSSLQQPISYMLNRGGGK